MDWKLDIKGCCLLFADFFPKEICIKNLTPFLLILLVNVKLPPV